MQSILVVSKSFTVQSDNWGAAHFDRGGLLKESKPKIPSSEKQSRMQKIHVFPKEMR